MVVPPLGESIANCLVARWLKAEGDAVAADETIAEIETEKATLDIAAPAAGTLAEIVVLEGAEAEVGAVIARIAAGAAAPARAAAPRPAAPAAAPAAAPSATSGGASQPLSPAVRKLVEENGLDPAAIAPSGPGGRLTKGDVLAFLETRTAAPAPAPAAAPRQAAPAQPAPATRPAAPAPTQAPSAPRAPDPRGEERVRMTRLRQTIAHRLKEAQNTAAMLTTFNEVDMSQVLFMRDRFREEFERRHGVRLGLMSFFVKAAVKALKEIPAINAEIQGDEIVYRNYYDVGVAVGGPGGLVVPVLRDADKRDFADIERSIADFGRRAHEGKLTLADLTGGTFTVTNGGVFGSMLSTPILNPPQSGILGMHNIVRRPVAVRGANGGEEIAIRPIMYLALSYDHRIVDGREAVTFLVRIKQAIEAPERLLVGL
ncbi:MAG: 2-oxoglutarate dehydrogenase complex dihydrolipoyllysine-residue succinyltransferase [Alphaproteobacteria bacterium]